LSHYKQLYIGQPLLDSAYSDAEVRLTRIVSPGWTVSVFGDYTKEVFASEFIKFLDLNFQQAGNYNQERGGVNVRWQMARKLALTFEYDRYNRDSDIALYSFGENRLWVRLQYGSAASNNTSMNGGVGSDAPVLNVISTDPFNIPTPSH
jgi:hypothetical protein